MTFLASALAAATAGLPDRSRRRFQTLMALEQVMTLLDEGYVAALGWYISSQASYWIMERGRRRDIEGFWEGDSFIDPGLTSPSGAFKTEIIYSGCIFCLYEIRGDPRSDVNISLTYRYDTDTSLLIQGVLKREDIFEAWHYELCINPPESLEWTLEEKDRVQDGVTSVLQEMRSEHVRRRFITDVRDRIRRMESNPSERKKWEYYYTNTSDNDVFRIIASNVALWERRMIARDISLKEIHELSKVLDDAGISK